MSLQTPPWLPALQALSAGAVCVLLAWPVPAPAQAALAQAPLAQAALAHAAPAQPADDAVFPYTVQRGDTLIGVGRRLLVEPRRWPELARANQLRNVNRLPTGLALNIPLRLMRTEAVSAEVLHVVGEARAGAQPGTRAGDSLAEGSELSTGPDSHVTLRLVDGTLLRLRPDSRLQLRESRRVPDAAVVRSGARLQQGRVEVEAAPAKAGRPGFTIDTPQGVLGVRGTEFRVFSDVAQNLTRGEVLGGVVAFAGNDKANVERVQAVVVAGFGALIGGSGQVTPPVRLLPQPDTSALPTLQERLLMRFPIPALPGATAYRGQIARDASFDTVVADLTSATPELRFAELPDGDYVLRVRAIDAQGLEGRDADLRFRLKARPEAPLPSGPAPGAVLFGGQVDFGWTANRDADSYRLQLAGDAGFGTPLRDLPNLQALALTLEGLDPGRYQWRLASVRADGDQGPWGDPRSFEMRPPPPVPKPPVVGDNSIGFAWEGRPGQTFEFQVATDLAFTQLLVQRTLDQPGIDLPIPAPGSGRFYVRLRARDADGFVGPYTTPQYFDVPNCLRSGGGLCVRVGEQTLNLVP